MRTSVKGILVACVLSMFSITAYAQTTNKVVVITMFGDDAASKWRGQWTNGTSYEKGDLVEDLDSSYIARSSHTAQTGTNDPQNDADDGGELDFWDLVAAKGATGEKGDTGAASTVAGPQGPQGPMGVAGPGCTLTSCVDDMATLSCGAPAVAINIECVVPTMYAIGDTGPAGGKVFYVTNGGLNGLEAAPTYLSSEHHWGCYGSLLSGAYGTAIGTGDQNTSDIISECVGSEVTAAEAADSYSLNGESGWFLPSIDELEEMPEEFFYNHDPLYEVPGIYGDLEFASSTQIDANSAWWNVFEGRLCGGLFCRGKLPAAKVQPASFNARVWPIRAF